MGQSYFVWNGTDCRTKGIITQGPAPIIRPEERAQHVAVQGLSGDLTLLEGESVYNSYIQTLSIHAKSSTAAQAAMRWLRGAGEVTFSGEPNRKQKARVIGAVTLTKHSRNSDWWSGEVQFYCHPLKSALTEPEVTVTFGQTLNNDGDVDEKPLITLTGTGGMTVSIDGKTLTITEVTEEQGGAVIDTDGMMVTALLTGEGMNAQTIGDFPFIPVGSYAITFTGATCKVLRRKRWI